MVHVQEKLSPSPLCFKQNGPVLYESHICGAQPGINVSIKAPDHVWPNFSCVLRLKLKKAFTLTWWHLTDISWEARQKWNELNWRPRETNKKKCFFQLCLTYGECLKDLPAKHEDGPSSTSPAAGKLETRNEKRADRVSRCRATRLNRIDRTDLLSSCTISVIFRACLVGQGSVVYEQTESKKRDLRLQFRDMLFSSAVFSVDTHARKDLKDFTFVPRSLLETYISGL